MPETSNSTSGSATLTMPSDRDLVITRVFNAPRHLVWETLTRPEHVKRWYGLRAAETHIREIDLRVGGDQEDRDGHIASGMEPGMQETLDRLDEFVASL